MNDNDVKEKWDAEEEFRHKLIYELHDIALSLRKISGRDMIDMVPKKTSYKEFYFTPTDT